LQAEISSAVILITLGVALYEWPYTKQNDLDLQF